MFKCAIVLCVVFFVSGSRLARTSDSSPINSKRVVWHKDDSNAAYEKSRHAWAVATRQARNAMASCNLMVRNTHVDVPTMYKTKSDVIDNYALATRKLMNDTFVKISSFTELYGIMMYGEFIPRMNEVIETVTDAPKTVNTSECEVYSNEMKLSKQPNGLARELLWMAAYCNAGDLRFAMDFASEIDKTFLTDEKNRVDAIFNSTLDCRITTSQGMSPSEIAQCHRRAKRQLARGGQSFIDHVVREMETLDFVVKNLRNSHDTCTTNAGIPQYFGRVNYLLEEAKKCMEPKLAEARKIEESKKLRDSVHAV